MILKIIYAIKHWHENSKPAESRNRDSSKM